MANMNPDYASRRNYPASAPYGHGGVAAGSGRGSGLHMFAGRPVMHSGHNDGMTGLGHAFSTMSMASPQTSYGTRGNSHIPASTSDYGMYHAPVSAGGMIYPAGAMHIGASSGQVGNMYSQVNPYMAQNYPAGYAHAVAHDGNHSAPSWTSSRVPSDATHSTMPTLITPRRGSVSSTEDHIPATPYNNYAAYHNGVAILDRSPNGHYTNNTTPSPSQYISTYGGIAKPYNMPPVPMQMQILLKQEPAIPPAIPAPSSPVKPLDRCLENKNGETNVYIRGLLPETTDEMLHDWGARFGDIASSKSIIDHKSNLCKGFGFIKYHNFEDAEASIRGFHHLGYEVSFARESFYSKLKKFSDELNTNLYVSNIPRNFNEHELSNVFLPFKVCSARILRDERGNGRGVGFARFDTRDICEEVIKTFNNHVVKKAGVEDHVIQIRFSDTMEQKNLKQHTAAARQFRAAEFEYGCSQALRAGILPPSSAERIQAQQTHHAYNSPENHGYNVYMPQGHGPSAYIAPPVMGTARRNLMPYVVNSTPLSTIRSESSVKAETVASPACGESLGGEVGSIDRGLSSTPVSGHKGLAKPSPEKIVSPIRIAASAL